MSSSDILINIEEIALTGEDLVEISRKLGQPNVEWILYNDLAKVNNIKDLFMGNIVAVFVLLEIVNQPRQNVGHWIYLGLDADNNKIIHYDSYGFDIDQETSITGQDKGLLLNLIGKSGLNLDVNRYKHQSNSERDNTNTCGRFCSVRSVFFHLNNKQFNDFIIMPPIRDKLIANPDILISSLTAFTIEADHNQHLELLDRLNLANNQPVFT